MHNKIILIYNCLTLCFPLLRCSTFSFHSKTPKFLFLVVSYSEEVLNIDNLRGLSLKVISPCQQACLGKTPRYTLFRTAPGSVSYNCKTKRLKMLFSFLFKTVTNGRIFFPQKIYEASFIPPALIENIICFFFSHEGNGVLSPLRWQFY